MPSTNSSVVSATLLLAVGVALFTTGPRASAQTEIVISNFSPSTEEEPCAGVIFDSAGNLYGTTFYGGTYDGGTVFELSPVAGSGWTQKVLYNFQPRGAGGFYPLSSLIFDPAGNLYGTASDSYDGGTGGSAYRLTPQAGGNWAETVLDEFARDKDQKAGGFEPVANLIFDAAGNLYGTTNFGGPYHGGIAFQLTPQPDGSWKQTVLHIFGSGTKDGVTPNGALVLDASGNLYGTTLGGGAYGKGTVYELSPKARGGWGYRQLYGFGSGSTDGESPYSNLVFDAVGNLYGTTGFGGAYDRGTVFELSPEAGGSWKETVLYSFNNSTDGGFPVAGVTFDAAGNLYGTTNAHGPYNAGSVFELTPEADGTWTETLLYTFTGKADGGRPEAGVILDAVGNVFGTTVNGGTGGGGTVFEITR
jgi:uncharacterized repeat protein (TIGR03803 family)